MRKILIFKVLMSQFVFAGFLVPLNDSSNWQTLQYSKIRPHKLGFSQKGLTIHVDSSAMPFIYPFKKAAEINKITISGRVDKLINLSHGKTQGEEGADDFIIKLGLVLPGKETLNWFQKAIAADWITTLFELASDSEGVDHILFLNAVQNREDLDKKRNHPLGKGLMKEENKWLLDKPGEFNFSAEFPDGKDVLALWLSTDGDDTQSDFTLIIDKISVE